jgi:hypothetical protein
LLCRCMCGRCAAAQSCSARVSASMARERAGHRAVTAAVGVRSQRRQPLLVICAGMTERGGIWELCRGVARLTARRAHGGGRVVPRLSWGRAAVRCSTERRRLHRRRVHMCCTAGTPAMYSEGAGPRC